MTYKNINIFNDNNILDNLYILNNNIYNIDKNIIGVIENIKDIFYKITWYNNIINEEYYFSFDCVNYYKDEEKNTLLFIDKIKYINVKNNSWNEICILNYKDSKIYRKNNYCDCGTFYFENNMLIGSNMEMKSFIYQMEIKYIIQIVILKNILKKYL